MKEDLAKGQRIQPHLLLNNVMAEATTVFRRCTARCAFYCAQKVWEENIRLQIALQLVKKKWHVVFCT